MQLKKTNNDLKTLIRKSLSPTLLYNEVQCEKCNKKSEKTEKYNHIRRLPPYLLISINLTSYSSQMDEPKKINEKLIPLIELNIVDIFKELGPELKIEGEYKLYAVIIHKGLNTDSGHYYVLGRNLSRDSDKNWYIFDDKNVVKMEENLNLENILEENETPTIFFFENTGKKDIIPNITATIRN